MGVGGDRDITAMRVFRMLPMLRARREIRVFVDVARSFFARRQPTSVEARVSWRSRTGQRYSETFAHDLAVWEDFVLHRQKRPTRINQINARQMVFRRDFLRAQMLFHGHGKIGSAFDGGVIGDDHALHARDAPDARHHAC